MTMLTANSSRHAQKFVTWVTTGRTIGPRSGRLNLARRFNAGVVRGKCTRRLATIEIHELSAVATRRES